MIIINKTNPNILSRLKIRLSYKDKYLLCIFCFLNLLITLPLAVTLNVWIDEYYSLSTSGSGIFNAIHQSLFFELQPPLYYVLLSIWLKLNQSIFFARCFSVICIILTIYVSIYLSKRYLKDFDSKVFLACITLNPFTIYSAIEIRPPALGMLLSSLMLLFFFDGYLSKKTNLKSQIFYIITSILAIYTQYYLGFLVIAHGVVILSLRDWTKLHRYLLSIGLIAISLLPIISILPYQVYHHASDVGIDIQDQIHQLSILGGLSFSFERLSSFVIPSNIMSVFWARIFRIGLFLLLAYVLFRQFWKFKQTDKTIWIMVFSLLFLIVPLFILVSSRLMQPRHLTVLFLPTFLLMVTLFKFILPPKKLLSSLGVISILITYSFCNYFTYKSVSKPGDWKRVASYVKSIEQPYSPIVVFNGSLAPLLQYYYSGRNTIVALPQKNYFKEIDSYKEINHKSIINTLSCMKQQNNHFILVSSTYFDVANISKKSDSSSLENIVNVTSFSDINTDLETYIEKTYETKSQKKFNGTLVRVLQKKNTNLDQTQSCQV